jgi:hypothetical protein
MVAQIKLESWISLYSKSNTKAKQFKPILEKAQKESKYADPPEDMAAAKAEGEFFAWLVLGPFGGKRAALSGDQQVHTTTALSRAGMKASVAAATGVRTGAVTGGRTSSNSRGAVGRA